MFHMLGNPESTFSITLTPYASKAGTVKTYTVPAESSNLLSAIRMMDEYIKSVFSGKLFTGETEKNIANIKQEIVSRIEAGKRTGNFVPYTFNELIDRTVHDIKGIINVQEQIQQLQFRGKEKIEEACTETLTKYQNFKNPPMQIKKSEVKADVVG